MFITVLILLIVSLAVSAVGWIRFIWFFSVGYGYSISALAVTLAIMHGTSITWVTGLLLLLLFAYGIRLSTYLLVRELKNRNYVRTVDLDVKQKQDYSVALIITIWVSCALLYVGEISPIAFRLIEPSAVATQGWGIAGLVIALLGAAMEALADKQKNDAKKLNPKRFVDTGLYKIVRCPNYLGEILLWTGVFVSGIGCYHLWWQWVIALLGYIGIVYVMFSGTRRIELRQDINYGSDPEFKAYVKKTPILLPFIPLYSVSKYKWLKG